MLAALPRVYGAAFAASGDAGVAALVAERVLLADRSGNAGALVERAVLLAVRTSPHAAFAGLSEQERETVALARLAGATVTRAAELLGIDRSEVRALMVSGLRGLRRDDARRTPRPPRDSGSAASPARGGRAS